MTATLYPTLLPALEIELPAGGGAVADFGIMVFDVYEAAVDSTASRLGDAELAAEVKRLATSPLRAEALGIRCV
jgi:hypothetical protein